MVRLSQLSWALLAISTVLPAANAQQAAYDLLPDTVQAVVWVPDGEQIVQRWDRTQLAKLATEPAVRPFFEEQRQAIQDRLVDGGWKLNITPTDLFEFSTGQIAVAWMEKPESPRKPFSLAMLAGVEDDLATNERLMQTLDKQLAERKPQQREKLKHLGVSIVKYTMTKRADQLLAEVSYFAVTKGMLVVTDDEPLMLDILARLVGGAKPAGKVLSEDPVFVAGRQLAKINGAAQLEFFVRPLGVARVLRSIGGKRSKSNADILVVLQNQGFSSIRCVCGELSLGEEMVDMRYNGYILADRPLPGSAGVLDFPNAAVSEVPRFVGQDISSLFVTNWNANVAFWKVRGLVDEFVGQVGTFDEVIKGIKQDLNGPGIDIAEDVLPQLTNDIIAIADSQVGAVDIDSRRNLIAIKIKDSKAMADVLDHGMRNEPNADRLIIDGHAIWKVVHQEDEVVDFEDDFGEFGAAPAAQDKPEPWLSSWAITVYGDYLMFASHVEMIQDAIAQARRAGDSPLSSQPDFVRTRSAIEHYFGKQPASGWQIVRNHLAFRVPYELFRAGKFNESQSMLSSVLDRLLESEQEIPDHQQVLQGDRLPPFETIQKFLQPGGKMFRSTDAGWEFGGFLLSADQRMHAPPPATANQPTTVGTARANTRVEAKR